MIAWLGGLAATFAYFCCNPTVLADFCQIVVLVVIG